MSFRAQRGISYSGLYKILADTINSSIQKAVLFPPKKYMDVSGFQGLVGYKHTVTFREGLQKAIDWYRENLL